jgi:hypothetical protein
MVLQPFLRASLAIWIVIAATTSGYANVPVFVYKDDPDYEHAHLASRIAPTAVMVPTFREWPLGISGELSNLAVSVRPARTERC